MRNESASTLVPEWVEWYFTRGALSLLLGPFFVVFAASILWSVAGFFFLAYGLFVVTNAVFGLLPGLLAIFVGQIPLILPVTLQYAALRRVADFGRRPDWSSLQKLVCSLGIVIAYVFLATVIYEASRLGIGWIADRDPCAAFEAGVTGSVRPVDCEWGTPPLAE